MQGARGGRSGLIDRGTRKKESDIYCGAGLALTCSLRSHDGGDFRCVCGHDVYLNVTP